MGTVQSAIIDPAFRLIDQISPGYIASTDHYTVALNALNQMISEWSADGTAVYTITSDTLTLTSAVTYTWSSGGNLTTSKPVRIKAIRCTNTGGITLPVRVVDATEFNALMRDASAAGQFPDVIFYDYGLPTGILSVYPGANGSTLTISSYKALTAFAAITDTVSLPAGYEHALRLHLAILIAPEFRRQIPDGVPQQASAAKAALAALNAKLLGTIDPIPNAAQEGSAQ